LAFSQRGIHYPRKSVGEKRAGEFLRAQALYDLPTKHRCGALSYILEESLLVLLGAKRPLCHSAEMREKSGSWRDSDLSMWQ
jgi:hypothetical protein